MPSKSIQVAAYGKTLFSFTAEQYSIVCVYVYVHLL